MGIVPVPTVPLNPYELYASRCLDDGDVLRDVGWDWDTPGLLAVVRTAELERWCSGDACEVGENMLRLARAAKKIGG